MLEDHRGASRHDSLMSAYPEDDSGSVWMVSYIDIMTLLVALFVIIVTAGGATQLPLFSREAPEQQEYSYQPEPALEVPLPAPLAELRRKRLAENPVLLESGALNPVAIVAALGVAGLPSRLAIDVPPLLALPKDEAPDEKTLPFVVSLPRLLVPSGLSLQSPLAEFMVVLTDHPPLNVQEIDDDAVSGAMALEQALSQRVEESPYLPDLEGVEVSRVAEGIKLRVQDQLLFPSAQGQLTTDGQALVESLVETIQRYAGEVAVEGHSDSQSINTEDFPSNWALSSARAIAIVHALEDAGVARERLRAVGLADTRPIADNDTMEGRARNRRVEVVLHVE